MPQQKMMICAYTTIKQKLQRTDSWKKGVFPFQNVIYESLYWKYSFLAPVGCLIKKVVSAQSLDKRLQLCIAAERHLKLSARFSGFLIGGT